MKIRSKLADVDFVFGRFEYKKDHLIIHSAPSQSLQSKVYVSPVDILSALGQALANPMVWVYLIGFPVFLVRYRLRHAQASWLTSASNSAGKLFRQTIFRSNALHKKESPGSTAVDTLSSLTEETW